jgi:hypothetical protein
MIFFTGLLPDSGAAWGLNCLRGLTVRGVTIADVAALGMFGSFVNPGSSSLLD